MGLTELWPVSALFVVGVGICSLSVYRFATDHWKPFTGAFNLLKTETRR